MLGAPSGAVGRGGHQLSDPANVRPTRPWNPAYGAVSSMSSVMARCLPRRRVRLALEVLTGRGRRLGGVDLGDVAATGAQLGERPAGDPARWSVEPRRGLR